MRPRRGAMAAMVVAVLLTGCASERAPAAGVAAMSREATAGAEAGGDPPHERLLVRTARLEIERGDPEAGVRAATEVAKRMGGWVQRSSADGATLMVPADQLDPCLAELAKLGDVVHRNVTGDDVTEEFHDLGIHLDNLEKERERYLDLLSRAASVTEATVVEKELERVSIELERLKGRRQFLDQGVRFSSVEAEFARPLRPGPVGWVFYGLFVGVKWLLVWD